MATELIQVPEGQPIKPGDEVFDGRWWRVVRADNFTPRDVQPGEEVRRKFNPHPVEYRDAFSMNE